MGLVTIFAREDCEYCGKALGVLERCIAKLKAEDPELKLDVRKVMCYGATAALCVRLTASITVPHVFVQEEYIGDCQATAALAERTDEKGLLAKLRAAGKMTKVTEATACSPLPTPNQLRALGRFGIRGLINVMDPRETCFDAKEADFLTPEVAYVNAPLLSAAVEADLRGAVRAVLDAPQPRLVHCDTGVRAALVALIAAAVETGSAEDATADDFVEWGRGVGANLKPHAEVAVRVLKALAAAAAAPPDAPPPPEQASSAREASASAEAGRADPGAGVEVEGADPGAGVEVEGADEAEHAAHAAPDRGAKRVRT